MILHVFFIRKKMKMSNRIIKNEEKLDNILMFINDINKTINKYDSIYEDITDVNKYYGSKAWFSDKEKYETGKIKKIKAGVLSEDSVWNMLDDINELSNELEKISLKIKECINNN